MRSCIGALAFTVAAHQALKVRNNCRRDEARSQRKARPSPLRPTHINTSAYSCRRTVAGHNAHLGWLCSRRYVVLASRTRLRFGFLRFGFDIGRFPRRCAGRFQVPLDFHVRFSNRPFGVKRLQTIHRCSVDVAHGLVLLFGNRPQGPSIMGFEDGVEQPFGRPCCQTNGRSMRPNELTSSIVPRGTSFHCSVELAFPSIAFDLVRPSCRCGFPGPAELGAVDPYAVHAQALSQDHLFDRSMLWAAS